MKKILWVLAMVLWINGTTTAYAKFGDVTLKYGSTGADVAVLQQKLNALGYWCESDGAFGVWTKKMVVKFQTEHNIKPTGIVGSLTAKRLTELTSSPSIFSAVNGIISSAKKYMGLPYIWGGTTNRGFDCSGFTQFVMKENGISIPRTAALQFGQGIPVKRKDLKDGDLVFFTTYKPGASHVGFYLGNEQFIHASSAAGMVTISSLRSEYYTSRYIGARRY